MSKILIWAPAPSKQNKNMCPFIGERIYELKKIGYDADVLMYGRLNIIDHILKAKHKGILGFLLQIRNTLSFCMKFYFNIRQNPRHRFKAKIGAYYYYNSLNFRSYDDFFKWYKKQGYVFIHCHFLWYGELLPFLKERYGIKYIITGHGSDIHETYIKYPEYVSIYNNVMHKADKVIFVSKFLLKKAQCLGYNKNNYSIIYNGYNPTVFYPLKEPKKFDVNNLILGFVGHTISVKRVNIFPEVLRIIKNVYPNTTLMIIGSSDDPKTDLIPQLKSNFDKMDLLSSVVFVGKVPPEKVGEYLRQMDILLLPSKAEGLPCVTIEAKACGVPVIASANGGISEAVGKDGICVNESEKFTFDFANAIMEYCQNPLSRDDIIEHARTFTWSNTVYKEVELYKDIEVL